MKNNKYLTKLGIIGGTFDPIHLGHLIIANEIRDSFNLEEIIFIPAGFPPHKKEVTPFSHRLNMTKLAIENNDFFDASDIEIHRKGYTYTIDTLNSISSKNKDIELFFIIGLDSFRDIESWKNYKEILYNYKIIVYYRNIDSDIEDMISNYTKEYKNLYFFKSLELDISSTDIRNRIENNNTIRYLVPDKVQNYIYKNKLYK